MARVAVGISTGSDDTVVTESTAGGKLNVTALTDVAGTETAPVTTADGLLVNLGANNDVNVSQFGGNAVATGVGVAGVGVPRVTLSADAHDSPITERGTRISGRASAAAPTNVSADDDNVSLWALRNGQLVVQVGAAGALIAGDAANGLDVDVTRSALPTGAATLAEQQTQTTSLQLLDDVVVADNAAFTDGTTKLSMSGFIFDETAGTALTENDAAAARVNANRAIVSAIEDGATRARYATVTAANALKVDGSAVTQPVSLAANQSVNVAQINGVTPLMGNGVTGTGSQRVTIASDNTAFSVNATATGNVAADSPTSGNPVQVAGQMETMADSAPGTRMSADGDVNRPAMTDGAAYVITTGPQTWSYHEDSSSALTDASVHAAPGAGLSLYVQTIVVSLGAASALNVFFAEGASKVLGPYYLEAVNGRTLVINFTCPKKITANTALTVTTSAAVAHAIDVTGFTAPG